MEAREIFVSVDVETDGPIPGVYSMRSLGAAAFVLEGRTPVLIDVFEQNIQPIEGAVTDPETMQWWSGFPEAWEMSTRGARPAQVVMPEFVAWLRQLPGRVILLGCPMMWDGEWIHWYTIRFGGVSSRKGDLPFHMSARDIRQDAQKLLGNKPWYEVSREDMLYWADPSLKITHRCIDDALMQGVQGCNMIVELETGEKALSWRDERTTC